MSIAPQGVVNMSAAVPMATPPAIVEFWISTIRNLLLSSVREHTRKLTKQLEQMERYVLRMARSCECVPAKTPLNDGQKQNRKRVPTMAIVSVCLLLRLFERSFLCCFVSRTAQAHDTERPKYAPKAWITMLPPMSAIFNRSTSMASFTEYTTTSRIDITSSCVALKRPRTAPKDMSTAPAAKSAVTRCSRLSFNVSHLACSENAIVKKPRTSMAHSTVSTATR
mmetsp:Transcript_39084/g.103815  ORF Transcript_39084/g.103815 Transcript_39084/m.103815 type:complete len:224 (-) Transcript_39084:464-1135(-)